MTDAYLARGSPILNRITPESLGTQYEGSRDNFVSRASLATEATHYGGAKGNIREERHLIQSATVQYLGKPARPLLDSDYYDQQFITQELTQLASAQKQTKLSKKRASEAPKTKDLGKQVRANRTAVEDLIN